MNKNLSFLLKGVDYNQLISDYNAGKYNRPVPQLEPIEFSAIESIIMPSYSHNPLDDIYRTQGRCGEKLVVVTTNCENYRRTIEHLPPKSGGRCSYCHQDFTHQPISYPNYHKEVVSTENNIMTVKQYFWGEDCFCTYECALGYIRKTIGPSLAYRHDNLKDSESLLHYLYYLQYGKDKILCAAPDPRLLKENGGPLSRKDWSQNQSVFIPSSTRILLPAKSAFIQSV